MRTLWLPVALGIMVAAQPQSPARRTIVSIEGGDFLLGGRPTYSGRSFDGMPVQGLLFNSRMVQGIFDGVDSVRKDPANAARALAAAFSLPEADCTVVANAKGQLGCGQSASFRFSTGGTNLANNRFVGLGALNHRGACSAERRA